MLRIIAALVMLALVSTAARAEPLPLMDPTRFESPARCISAAGSDVSIVPGTVIVPPPHWDDLDQRLRQFEREAARANAENKSLRRSISKARSRWYYLAGAFTLGMSAQRGYSTVKGWF